MSGPASRRDWLVFLGLGLAWGSSYLFIKIGVETLSPLTLIAGRLFTGSLVLLAAVALTGSHLPRSPRVYGHLLVMAVFSIALPFFLIATAEQTTDSALAAIINATVPLFTIVIAAVVLQDEPITSTKVAGLLVGFAGVVVLVSRDLGAGLQSSGLLGAALLVGSSISYAAGAVYARRHVRGLAPAIPALFQVLFAFVITAVLALIFERPLSTSVSVDALVAVLWLGIVGSGLAYLLFFRLLGRWGATRTSLVAFVLPIVGIALGALVLHEEVDMRVIAGTVLIVGGVALVNSGIGPRVLGRLRSGRGSQAWAAFADLEVPR